MKWFYRLLYNLLVQRILRHIYLSKRYYLCSSGITILFGDFWYTRPEAKKAQNEILNNGSFASKVFLQRYQRTGRGTMFPSMSERLDYILSCRKFLIQGED